MQKRKKGERNERARMHAYHKIIMLLTSFENMPFLKIQGSSKGTTIIRNNHTLCLEVRNITHESFLCFSYT